MNNSCREWLEVLESGKYKKAIGWRLGIQNASEEGACAFGVAVHHFKLNWSYLRYEGICKMMGIDEKLTAYICNLNDKTTKSLPEIAREIRAVLVPLLTYRGNQ